MDEGVRKRDYVRLEYTGVGIYYRKGSGEGGSTKVKTLSANSYYFCHYLTSG